MYEDYVIFTWLLSSMTVKSSMSLRFMQSRLESVHSGEGYHMEVGKNIYIDDIKFCSRELYGFGSRYDGAQAIEDCSDHPAFARVGIYAVSLQSADLSRG